MTNEEKDYYVIEYAPNDSGIPHFMDKNWTPELPDYDIFKTPPVAGDFSDYYSVKIKAYKLDGDYFPEDELVSSEMLMLSSKLNVNFITIPINISLYRDKIPANKYFLFYLSSYLSIIDEKNSVFTISRDLETGKLNTPNERGLDKIYYERIDKFKIRNDLKEHLFYCKEISKPVCSSLFKTEFESLKLRGVNFKKIDDNFKYDHWAGWNDWED